MAYSILVIVGCGSLAAWLINGWGYLILDHPRHHGDLVVMLLAGLALVASALGAFVLSWQFPTRAPWALPLIYVLRTACCIAGFAGLTVFTAAFLPLFGRSTSHAQFESRFVWYFALFLGACWACYVILSWPGALPDWKWLRKRKRKRG